MKTLLRYYGEIVTGGVTKEIERHCPDRTLDTTKASFTSKQKKTRWKRVSIRKFTFPCIVHYIGDESLSVPTAHGNSLRQTKLYFRTKPSVVEEIQQRTELEKLHKIYKEMVCENTDGHDAISKLRDIKQLHNARAFKKEELLLSKGLPVAFVV